ncbi:uncharacterized protein ARMOST_14839 [Armillaria ostoyae]|uniref:Cytochrome b561 domain-containing protein n=2 Tax=Armillaria TaxID=47424 RepID=A0A284RRP0_ARMOS|nr:hypothetical protein ARMSODRAFT_920996 [Armillaria solidipes]SJL11436.1 uncharacterized protein ARMOST_14839 [Armillaria ostoyae]
MSQVPNFPLTPIEQQLKTHAILCTTGFLIFLPVGVLVPRYTRTKTNRWFPVHLVIQLCISAPVIFAGWALGHKSAGQLGLPHFTDPHQKAGLALLILYILQLVLGLGIHWVKLRWFARRPPQNYVHAVLGLVILALAAYQVHYGLYTEWTFATGGLHVVPDSAKHAWLALVVIFWVLYGIGLAFLRSQFQQEKQMIRSDDGIPLGSGSTLENRA